MALITLSDPRARSWP